ncbi:LacI family DNA-binding transcriptional regulator [Mycoplasma sp. 4463]|uniref:LacI family DNA-binding transcriptional regulator n=1 Tax=Mycoplasma sp. 4463 TaxID=3400998 RepID=UPI003AAE1BF1
MKSNLNYMINDKYKKSKRQFGEELDPRILENHHEQALEILDDSIEVKMPGRLGKRVSRKPITYQKISKLTGVSVATISRFYNDGYVSKDNRRKIEEIIKEYDYVPNPRSRINKVQVSSIFVISPLYGQSYIQNIISGIIAGASKNNRRVVTFYTVPTADEYIETLKYLLLWKPKSIVVFLSEENLELFDFLKTIKDVAVLVYGHKVDGVSWVVPDDREAFYKLTKSFIRRVPRGRNSNKIIFLEDQKLSDYQKFQRISGFKEACSEYSITYVRYPISAKKNKEEVKEIIAFANTNNVSNIICSTHDSFISINMYASKHFRISDIGYQSIYDSLGVYVDKIFVDYPYMGVIIESMITKQLSSKNPQTAVIKLKLISELSEKTS